MHATYFSKSSRRSQRMLLKGLLECFKMIYLWLLRCHELSSVSESSDVPRAPLGDPVHCDLLQKLANLAHHHMYEEHLTGRQSIKETPTVTHLPTLLKAPIGHAGRQTWGKYSRCAPPYRRLRSISQTRLPIAPPCITELIGSGSLPQI